MMKYLIYSVKECGWWLGRGEGVVHREKYAYRFPPDAKSLDVAKDVLDIIYPAPESVAELQAIVDKLPKTADGVTVTVPIRVYRHFSGKPWTLTGFTEEFHITDWEEVHDRFVQGSGMYYSTPEAAEAAVKEQS